MRRALFLCLCGLVTVWLSHAAFGATACVQERLCFPDADYINSSDGCSEYSDICVGVVGIHRCSVCKDGYKLIKASYTDSQDCEHEYSNCKPCGIWTDVPGKNYQEQELCVAGGENTAVTKRYRCNTGYYNKFPASDVASLLMLNCLSCAEDTGNADATSDVGTADINCCYVPVNTEQSDERGIFSFSEKCYYGECSAMSR